MGGPACAVLSNGTVQCWDGGASGALGNGIANEYSTTPVEVSGLTSAIAVSAGGGAPCALLADGSIQCWGINLEGELGDGTSTGPSTCSGYPCSPTPVAVSGLTGATSISSGSATACAVLAGGAVQCWGRNSSGELGDGTTTGPFNCTDAGSDPCSTTPVAVVE